jgi:hypothetical protein
MSAIAVFRPEIGSKSLAAHAARSFSRVVESIAQRFHSSSDRVQRVAGNEQRSTTVEASSTHGELAAPSISERNTQPQYELSSAGRLEGAVYHTSAALAHREASSADIGTTPDIAPKYSSPSAVYFVAIPSVAGPVPVADEQNKPSLVSQTRARHWKDCAIAAICSGIPSPVATLRSTPQAFGNPPSV